jgi:hypothetical protein
MSGRSEKVAKTPRKGTVRPSKADVNKFLKKPEKEEEPNSTIVPYQAKRALGGVAAKIAEDNAKFDRSEPLEGAFALVEPIPTCVGPIGKFVAEPDMMPLCPSIVAFGKRRTGKSFTFRDIMYHCFRDLPFGIVLTRTKMNGFWQRYVPPRFVFKGLRNDIMQKLVQRQTRLIEKWKKDHPDAEPDDYRKDKSLWAFCIMDDVIAEKSTILWNEDLNSFFVEGRHLCIVALIATQHVKGVGPMVRGNMDVVMMQPIFQAEARKVLHDLYAGYMHYDTFATMMDEIVTDKNLPGSTPQDAKKYVRTLFVMDFENTTNPQIKYKWYEAINPDDVEPGWRLCDDEYWKETPEEALGEVAGGNDVDPVEELESVRAMAGGAIL